MVQNPPFIRWVTLPGKREADAVFGFSLSSLPNSFVSSHSSNASQHVVDLGLQLGIYGLCVLLLFQALR